ncbi:MAG: RpiB/LacA/LacB family sugar-phosphate isomerase [Rickettsiales bacterium]|jgi:ribose 5-phosphate isomerase RpiB|nr:RpiB/LacA/LacB family sugar-phosphate isomerase [Rickettsiales bacterium]
MKDKQTIFIAGGHNCGLMADKIIENMDAAVLEKFNVVNIGASYKFAADYNAQFTALHIGNLVAKHVGEIDNLGVLLSGTGGGANLFACKHPHVRASVAADIPHVIELRKKMITNVIAFPVMGDKECLRAKHWAKMIYNFALTDISNIPIEELARTIRIMTHRNNPVRQYLWMKHPEFMSTYSGLYNRILESRSR